MSDSQRPSSALAMELCENGSVLTVMAPLTLIRRGGRKRVVTPDGGPECAHRKRRIDDALVKALARGFRWKRLIEDGHYGSIVELAAGERISQSYVRRLLRLTLLSPPIVEAVLDGRACGLRLEYLRDEFPVEWTDQNFRCGGAVSASRHKRPSEPGCAAVIPKLRRGPSMRGGVRC